jgi:dipeptidyl aminopeptidase/acylaminoacyl peptidase
MRKPGPDNWSLLMNRLRMQTLLIASLVPGMVGALPGWPPAAVADEAVKPPAGHVRDALPQGCLLRIQSTRFPLVGPIFSVAESPDGTILAAGGQDGAIRFWETATGKELRALTGHSERVKSVAFSTDGKTLVSGGKDKSVRLWDVATGQQRRRLEGHQGEVASVGFSPDGKLLASASLDLTVRLWETASGKELRQLRGHTGAVFCVAFSPDGKTLASAGKDRIVRLWDVAAGKELRSLRGAKGWLTGVAFSVDGKHLASAGRDQTIRLWEVATGREVHAVETNHGGVLALALARDAKTIAVATGDGAVRLWEVATGKERAVFENHEEPVTSVAFAPDGRTLASGGREPAVMIWDVTGLVQRPGSRKGRLSELELDNLWLDLSGNDAARAYRAVWALAAAPRQAVALAKERLHAVSAEQIARWIADLDSEEFVVREKATIQLEDLAEAAEPALNKVLESQPSLEVRRRVERILEQRKRQTISPLTLRSLRVIEVLERIGTPEARQVLETLARGAPENWPTQEAKAALERLALSSASRP